MKHLMLLSAITFGLASASTHAAPSADEVRNVLSYYYESSAGHTDANPVLVDFKFCKSIYREGSEKNNCKEEVGAHDLKVNEAVFAWMNFIVPRDQHGEVLLQLKHNGVIRGARKASVRGAIRYRTWRKINLSRTGEWQIPILYERDGVVSEIETVSLTVNEPLVSQVFPESDFAEAQFSKTVE